MNEKTGQPAGKSEGLEDAGSLPCCRSPRRQHTTPAEPDAGDVDCGHPNHGAADHDCALFSDAGDMEALTEDEVETLRHAFVRYSLAPEDWVKVIQPAVERIIAARLDAVHRKAGDGRAEQAWDEGWEHSVHPKDHNPYRTARIARESR